MTQRYSAEQAADPTTPPEVLQRMAEERPDLRGLIAANPACYPELLEWLDSLADPEVSGVVAKRRSAGVDAADGGGDGGGGTEGGAGGGGPSDGGGAQSVPAVTADSGDVQTVPAGPADGDGADFGGGAQTVPAGPAEPWTDDTMRAEPVAAGPVIVRPIVPARHTDRRSLRPAVVAGIAAGGVLLIAVAAIVGWALGRGSPAPAAATPTASASAAGTLSAGNAAPEVTEVPTSQAAPSADDALAGSATPDTGLPGTGLPETPDAGLPGTEVPSGAIALPAPWQPWDGEPQASQWYAAAANITAADPGPVRVRTGGIVDQAGPQAFADAVASGDRTRLARNCWTRSSDYIERSYLAPGVRGAVLAALSAEPMGNQIGLSWESDSLTVNGVWDEARSAFMCPDIWIKDGPADTIPADVTWLVHRYLRSLTSQPVHKNEGDYYKGCINDSDTGWNPVGLTPNNPDTIPFRLLPAQPFGAAPEITGPPKLTIGRNVVDFPVYYVAVGDIPFADGSTRRITFEASDGWYGLSPCLGNVYEGEPRGGVG